MVEPLYQVTEAFQRAMNIRAFSRVSVTPIGDLLPNQIGIYSGTLPLRKSRHQTEG